MFTRLLYIYRLNERWLYGRTGLSPARPLLPSRPKSGQVQSSRPSTRLLARSQRKRQISTRRIGPRSQMATSLPSRRLLLAAVRANSTSSSMKRRVSWRQRLELETRQLLITHPPNQWMSEHCSVMTIQTEITALQALSCLVFFSSFFSFHSISYLTFLRPVTIAGLPTSSSIPCSSSRHRDLFFGVCLPVPVVLPVCCRLFFLSNFSQHRLSSMLLVVVTCVVLLVSIIPIHR